MGESGEWVSELNPRALQSECRDGLKEVKDRCKTGSGGDVWGEEREKFGLGATMDGSPALKLLLRRAHKITAS